MEKAKNKLNCGPIVELVVAGRSPSAWARLLKLRLDNNIFLGNTIANPEGNNAKAEVTRQLIFTQQKEVSELRRRLDSVHPDEVLPLYERMEALEDQISPLVSDQLSHLGVAHMTLIEGVSYPLILILPLRTSELNRAAQRE